MHLSSSASVGIYVKMIEQYFLKSVLFVKLKNLSGDPQESLDPQMRNSVPATLLLSS